QHDACAYWLPIELNVAEMKRESHPASGERANDFECVALDDLFTGNVRDILTRPYVARRPDLCSLNLPDGLLGGWANFDVKATIDDKGWCGPGAAVQLANGVKFNKPAASKVNCCLISQWEMDKSRIAKHLQGRARRVHLLLAGTTFPQATRSSHAEVVITYATGQATHAELRSPNTWWPVEQDYLVDDYIFRLDPWHSTGVKVDWRVDLLSGKVRALDSTRQSNGGAIKGGSAFVVSIDVDKGRE